MSAKNAAKAEEAPTVPYAMTLNILGYRDEGEWVALALEMDIRGYGDTFDEALRDLQDLVIMQIRFALFKKQPEMILKAAEPIWFERFWEARRELLSGMFGTGSAPTPDYLARGLEIPPAHVIAEVEKGFSRANA